VTQKWPLVSPRAVVKTTGANRAQRAMMPSVNIISTIVDLRRGCGEDHLLDRLVLYRFMGIFESSDRAGIEPRNVVSANQRLSRISVTGA